MNPVDTSPAGRHFIAGFEGRVLHTYLDIRGIPTIGIGCTGPEAWPGRVITDAECDEMFARRLDVEFEPGVLRAIKGAPTAQAQFDAMVSLAFNIGVGAFAGSTVAKEHIAGNYEAAAAAFERFDKVRINGVLTPNTALLKRRKAEAAMYLSQRAPVAPAPSYDRYKCAKAFQSALMLAGLYAGEVDGKWGPKSRDAYERFDRG